MPQFVPPPQPPVLIQPLAATPKAEVRTTNSAILLGPPIYTGHYYPDRAVSKNTSTGTSLGWQVTGLIARERNGDVREYELVDSPNLTYSLANEVGRRLHLLGSNQQGDTNNQDPNPLPEEEEANSTTVIEPISIVEVVADRQEYDEKQQVITASGNVEMRFAKALLRADRLRINLPNRLAVAEGNVVLKRGDQVLRGERIEYFFFRNNGIIFNASGEVYQPSATRDLSPTLPNDEDFNRIPDRPLSDRLQDRQPLRRVTTAEGYRFAVGSSRDLSLLGASGGLATTQTGGRINRLRFQAEQVDFDADRWVATNMRLTNDPFSPPELVVSADTATYRNIEPQVDELITTNSRVVLDQTVSVPIFQDRLVFDRRPRQPGLVRFGFDGEERGGLFVERTFNVVDQEQVRFDITPQYYIQRAIFSNQDNEGGIFNPSSFGVRGGLGVNFQERTTLGAVAELTSLDLSESEDNLKANVRLQQKIGPLNSPHNLSLEYSYRDRIFNGSLGFQRVQSSIGLVLTSPVFFSPETGISFTYQTSIQNIDARTDRQDLIQENQGDDIVNLYRYQGAASLNRSFYLWQGKALPATPSQGLRFSSTPVLPFLQLDVGITGVTSFYSNDDNQSSLTFSLGVQGQIGHFSRSYLDYTGFSFRYSQGIRGNESPFLFDRFVDTRTLSLGITQQIYGPFRFGVQTAFNVDNGNEISTDYVLEYSRRTYNILLRYNPVLQLGSLNLRVSDFNWLGTPEPFEGSGIRPVVQGVDR